jgi:tyrosine-protein kinase Etk/Wzc
MEQKIQDLQNRVKDYHQTMTALSSIPSALNTASGKQALFEIQRSDVPYAADLKPLLSSYDNVTARYTAQHPEVLKIENQILVVLDRMNVAIKSEIDKKNNEIEEVRRVKAGFVEDLLKSSEVQQSDHDVESNYLIYQKLYNEMKVKLEEAEISKALDSNVGDQYIVMDPPLLPLFPSKPSKSMIIGGGFVLGVLMGILSAIVAEILDTTIRSEQAVEIYGKPIIGFLPYDERKKN